MAKSGIGLERRLCDSMFEYAQFRIGARYLSVHHSELFTETGLVLFAPFRSLVFGVVFFGLWWWQKRLRYLLYFSVSFTLFAVGICVQTLGIPRDIAWNFMVSAILYT